MAAATAILDRGHGKPTQNIEGELHGTLEHRLSQMTPEERLKDAREVGQKMRARLAELGMVIEHEPYPAAARRRRSEGQEDQ